MEESAGAQTAPIITMIIYRQELIVINEGSLFVEKLIIVKLSLSLNL